MKTSSYKYITRKLISPGFAFIHDLLMIPLAWITAYYLRFNLDSIPEPHFYVGVFSLLIVIPVQVATYKVFGLYRGVWRYASMPDLMRVIKAAVIGTSIAVILLFIYNRLQDIPRSVPFIHMLLLIIYLAGPRFVYRWFKDYGGFSPASKKVLIVGAGSAGEMLVRDLLKDYKSQYQPVAFIDDNQKQIGKEIHGIRVLGNAKKITQIVKSHDIDIIMLAIPSATSRQMRRIIKQCTKADVPFRTLPRLQDLVSGQSVLRELREVSIDDILGREVVNLDAKNILRRISGKVILVSGAGGSIGSELVRQIYNFNPAMIILLDNGEYNLYSLMNEFSSMDASIELKQELIDVTDKVAVDSIIKKYRPTAIFHAAAYKHVPMLEGQIRSAIKNNVFGTKTIAEAADKYKVEEFVLVSTDKAVNPTNIMGATKRVAEIICQSLNAKSNTKYITVRFGNVLDSAGSVVPLFRKQIENGGPVTVTDPDITRYFMTIPEACQLIMQASVIGTGGEIFILDMGEPIKIDDLAKQMILLSGKKPGIDIPIRYTGLRPGEKMYEELRHAGEEIKATPHEKITLASSRSVSDQMIDSALINLKTAVSECNNDELLKLLKLLVPEFDQQSDNGSNILPFSSHTKVVK